MEKLKKVRSFISHSRMCAMQINRVKDKRGSEYGIGLSAKFYCSHRTIDILKSELERRVDQHFE